MSKTFLIISILIIYFGCGVKKESAKKYHVEGVIENLKNGEVVLEKLDLVSNERAYISTDTIVNSQFTFSDTISGWGLHSLVINDTIRIPFFVEPGKIKITIPDFKNDSAVISGGINNQLLAEHRFSFDKTKGVALIEKFPNTVFGAFTTYYVMMNNNFEGDTLEQLISKLSGDALGSVYIPHIKKVSKAILSTAIGKKAPNFAVLDSMGKELRLYDLKGKYVLLDFWTSWCKPCREANPLWKKMYDKYKNNNLEFMGVSFDVKCQPWKKALIKDELPWPNGCNCAGWDNISDIYGVKSVPQTFLIHPDGTILEKNIKPTDFEKIFIEHIRN
jgi:thiol-disulfide isomerase/thioredoxin